MATTTIYRSDAVALWLQKTCTSPLVFLGCQDASDLTLPAGDITRSYKRVGKGDFRAVASRTSIADTPTITFTSFREVVNLIRDIPCEYNVFVYYSNCGADDDPTNYDFADIISGISRTEITQAAVSNAIGPDGATDVAQDITQEVSASFLEYLTIKAFISTTLTASLGGRIIDDIAVCDPDPECGNCDTLTDGCETLYIITRGSPGFYGDAEIFKSTDSGATYVEQTNAMTNGNDNLSSVDCRSDVAIVANGQTAEYQFTTDGGTTWTLVTTPAQIINQVFMLSETKAWFAANGGFIYFSNDRGASVSIQTDGSITAQNLNSIGFSDGEQGYAVGDSNAFLVTTNGGTNWSALTGPAAGVNLNYVLAIPDTDIIFIGDANGVVYRSIDSGATFTTSLTGVTAFSGGITALAGCACNRVLVTGQDSNGLGTVQQTIDGGNVWTNVSTPADGADTINSITCCDFNTYFGVGDDGLIFKLAGQSFRDLV